MNNEQKELQFMQDYSQKLQKELDLEKTRRMGDEKSRIEMSGFAPSEEKDIVRLQLEIEKEINRYYRLLSGHQLYINEDGVEDWKEPDDDRLKILSNYGVKQIINVLSFYLSKTHLLSIYDLETINRKLYGFGNELNDLILTKYEYMFHYPTPEDLFDKLKPIVEKEKLEIGEKELYWKCVQWSTEQLKEKIRHYPIIIRQITDIVHSTYLRALGGQTLKSLRTMTHISENRTLGNENQYADKSRFNIVRPGTW